MAAQYELLSQLLKSGGRLDMGQELFYKFYQAFVLKDRWLQYIGGVGTTLLVTAEVLRFHQYRSIPDAYLRFSCSSEWLYKGLPVFHVFCRLQPVLSTNLCVPDEDGPFPETFWNHNINFRDVHKKTK